MPSDLNPIGFVVRAIPPNRVEIIITPVADEPPATLKLDRATALGLAAKIFSVCGVEPPVALVDE